MVATTTATTAGAVTAGATTAGTTAGGVATTGALTAGTTAGLTTAGTTTAGLTTAGTTTAGLTTAGTTTAGLTAGTTGTTGGLAAGTLEAAGTTGGVAAGGGGAASGGFGSWLHSMLFGEAAQTTGEAIAGKAGEVITEKAATEGLIGVGGEYSTKSLLSNALTGASAASAVMSGISSSRQMKASKKQTEIQYHQEKNQALQKSNLIREAMLKDVASARATYASRGFTDDGTPSQVMNESANQANSDIGVVQTDSQIAGLQLRGQGKEYKRAATFSLLSGFGNGAGIVGNRILRK